jgi:hypothetical protein
MKYLMELKKYSYPRTRSASSIIKDSQKKAREWYNICSKKCGGEARCINKCNIAAYSFLIRDLESSLSRCSNSKCQEKIKLFIQKVRESHKSEKEAIKAW